MSSREMRKIHKGDNPPPRREQDQQPEGKRSQPKTSGQRLVEHTRFLRSVSPDPPTFDQSEAIGDYLIDQQKALGSVRANNAYLIGESKTREKELREHWRQYAFSSENFFDPAGSSHQDTRDRWTIEQYSGTIGPLGVVQAISRTEFFAVLDQVVSGSVLERLAPLENLIATSQDNTIRNKNSHLFVKAWDKLARNADNATRDAMRVIVDQTAIALEAENLVHYRPEHMINPHMEQQQWEQQQWEQQQWEQRAARLTEQMDAEMLNEIVTGTEIMVRNKEMEDRNRNRR